MFINYKILSNIFKYYYTTSIQHSNLKDYIKLAQDYLKFIFIYIGCSIQSQSYPSTHQLNHQT